MCISFPEVILSSGHVVTKSTGVSPSTTEVVCLSEVDEVKEQ